MEDIQQETRDKNKELTNMKDKMNVHSKLIKEMKNKVTFG